MISQRNTNELLTRISQLEADLVTAQEALEFYAYVDKYCGKQGKLARVALARIRATEGFKS